MCAPHWSTHFHSAYLLICPMVERMSEGKEEDITQLFLKLKKIASHLLGFHFYLFVRTFILLIYLSKM